MKNTVSILSLLLLLGTTAILLAGCGDGEHVYHGDYYITVVNHTPWDVYVEPFGVFLPPGGVLDQPVSYDVVHVMVIRDFDSLLLAELDMVAGGPPLEIWP